MAIDNVVPESLRAVVTELDRGLYNHEQWLDALFGTLICRLHSDERDFGGDAHRMCRLGQWYYSKSATTAALANRPGFAELGTEHERMHRYAARMLHASKTGEPISFDDYQRFVNALKRMRMEIFALKQDIEDSLYQLDPLTGIPGRIGVLAKLREQKALVQRGLQACSIAVMDIDRFKSVNDKFGHASGDKVLISFAHHMMQGLRPYDKVFRFGGEEFLIAMPDTMLDEGFAIVERLREILASIPHAVGPGEPLYVTASFGLASIDPDVPVEESIERADAALYAAKEAGRNRSVVWDRSTTTDAAASRENTAA